MDNALLILKRHIVRTPLSMAQFDYLVSVYSHVFDVAFAERLQRS